MYNRLKATLERRKAGKNIFNEIHILGNYIFIIKSFYNMFTEKDEKVSKARKELYKAELDANREALQLKITGLGGK